MRTRETDAGVLILVFCERQAANWNGLDLSSLLIAKCFEVLLGVFTVFLRELLILRRVRVNRFTGLDQFSDFGSGATRDVISVGFARHNLLTFANLAFDTRLKPASFVLFERSSPQSLACAISLPLSFALITTRAISISTTLSAIAFALTLVGLFEIINHIL